LASGLLESNESKGVGRKFSRGMGNGKNTEKHNLASSGEGGGQRKK